MGTYRITEKAIGSPPPPVLTKLPKGLAVTTTAQQGTRLESPKADQSNQELDSRPKDPSKMSMAPTAAPTEDDGYSSDRRVTWLVAVPVCWAFLALIFYCWYNFPPVRRPPGTPTH